MQRKPKLYGVYNILLVICILMLIAWVTLYVLNISVSKKVADAQEQSTQAATELNAIQNTKQYQKISFTQTLYRESKELPWSEHIGKLVDVLQKTQNLGNNGNIELYDFKVNLDTIEISGKVSRLALLYSPKGAAREGLISVVSDLDFLTDVRIQHYVQEDDMYEFTLYATIVLDEATE